MANRMKEDEKNERIIRGLLKLPPNRRCINCNNLGPQYVCTNFWTFICTNCSGAHREFTHRVKSVSMAKFTSQEVAALQEGGNERARAVYFKEWDPQRHSYPDSSNPDKLRTFIKNVYVDQRFTGEKNVDRGQRSKGDRVDYNENKRADSDRSGSRSPSYEEQYGDRYSSASRSDSRYSYGERSPGYDQGDYKRSPVQTEEVDNKRQDHRSEDGSHNRRLEDALKSDVKSPEKQKVVSGSSPPMVRPVRDILGDNAPRLQVGEPSKSNGTKVPENSSQAKRTLSSSSTGSGDGNNVQLKAFSSGSLIDFSAEPETPAGAATQPSLSQQTTSSSTDGGDWASFDVVNKQQMPHVPVTANTLESMLGELSIGAATSAGNMPVLPISGDLSFQANGEGHPSTQQQTSPLSTVDANNQPSMFPAADYRSQLSQMPVSGTSNTNNQPWSRAPAANVQNSTPGSLAAPGSHLPKINTKPPQQVTGPSEQPSSGRKELPADIFTLYQAPPVSASAWQRGPYPGMAYGMTYPTAVPMPAFPQHQNSGNPFDFNSNSASTFPSRAPLQGALPNMTASATLHQNQNLGVSSPQWAPPQLYSYPSAVSPSPFMPQQFSSSMLQQPPNHMMLMGHQGIGRPNIDGTTFGNSGMDQQPVARYSHPSTPNSSGSVGGNPFG